MNIGKSSSAVLTALLIAAPALATTSTNRQVSVTVNALSLNVTYNTGPETAYVVGYSVTVLNGGGNTINNVIFQGTTSVTDSAETAGFDSTDAAFCASTVGSKQISCSVGTLAAGASKSFTVTFRAPIKFDNNSVGDAAGSDFVSFGGILDFAEGQNDNPNNPPINDRVVWQGDSVLLGTASTTVVISGLTPVGGTFYTGAPLVTSSADKFAIKVGVPAQEKYSSVKLDEVKEVDPVQCAARNNFATCYQANIFIPDVQFSGTNNNFLEIFLRVDSSNILTSAKINRVLIQYDARPELSTEPSDLYTVGPCPIINGVAQPLSGAEAGKPCIADATLDGGSKGKVKTPPSFIWRILNIRNGKLGIF
jgi:hypothetical protein